MKPPKAFCFNRQKIKAFVLGCDPSNKSAKGKTTAQLDYVFGIGQDCRYFYRILENLNLIGLHLENVYIQNLIIDYLDEETGKNKDWEKLAEKYLSVRIKEFNKIT